LDLKSSLPFWPVKTGLPTTFPALSENIRCQAAVVGAGVTGALIADTLAEAGVDMVVLDRREAVHGSTCASTGLLQYEIDASLTELAGRHGEQQAVRAYRLCAEAIDRIHELTGELGDSCGFRRKPSCYFASRKRDVPALIEECALRQKHGFDVQFLSGEEFDERFDFAAPGALWTTHAAEVDAYQLTYRLLERAKARGARIFDRTDVVGFESGDQGWQLTTDRGATVAAEWLILATGYEATKLLPRKIVRLHSSFAIASQPLESSAGWPEQCLLWETARPYCYVRMTDDGRAIIGGEDEKFRSPTVRDALIERKSGKLQARFHAMFPNIPFEAEYAWAGTFGETKDGLPYIGSVPEIPNAIFALGYGGNGITYSVVAARLISDIARGIANEDSTLFGFNRK
jgi:glycine/D-amino acid oxidase-like deaminating enzyme